MANALLMTNARVMTPTGVLEGGWLLADGGRIRLMGAGDVPTIEGVEPMDAGGLNLLPGLIDVHVHGAVGYDTMDGTEEGLRCMAQFYAQHGTTSFLPTTWTEKRGPIMKALESVAANVGPQPDGATILGAHLEGPYISAEKVGAQRPEDVRRADREEALVFLDIGVIRLVALAPEFAENEWLIEECVRRGVTVSTAHSNATYDQIIRAVGLGLSHATHTYNAMTGLNHREPGTLGAVMTTPTINAELIADNIHVHPAAMAVLYAAKGRDRTVLITDAVRGAGLPEGPLNLDDRVVMIKDGAVRLPNGTLAGSTLTMERALRNFMAATGEGLDVLWPTASLNAARAIHVADRKGSLEVGKDADLVLVDDEVNVRLTVAEGRVVYRAAG